jgi:hypothetical protein
MTIPKLTLTTPQTCSYILKNLVSLGTDNNFITFFVKDIPLKDVIKLQNILVFIIGRIFIDNKSSGYGLLYPMEKECKFNIIDHVEWDNDIKDENITTKLLTDDMKTRLLTNTTKTLTERRYRSWNYTMKQHYRLPERSEIHLGDPSVHSFIHSDGTNHCIVVYTPDIVNNDFTTECVLQRNIERGIKMLGLVPLYIDQYCDEITAEIINRCTTYERQVYTGPLTDLVNSEFTDYQTLFDNLIHDGFTVTQPYTISTEEDLAMLYIKCVTSDD